MTCLTNLAGSHGKDKEKSEEGPCSLVVEELQVVSPEVVLGHSDSKNLTGMNKIQRI